MRRQDHAEAKDVKKQPADSLTPDLSAAPTPRRNFARWRALCLSLVYVVFAIHIIHWKISGKTLAPLELNEVMYTLELGIITAGFVFMCLLVLGTMIIGRFFCSWACHIMVLQDLCAWVLRKVGIRTKPIRSRLLLLVPPLTAFYMFIWPQIIRAWHDKAFPAFHVATEDENWKSFITDNFWRNLPGPWIIALTFVVCGFVMVYVLGSRTFCTYVCPYGAIFGLADRFAPGNIRVSDACQQCGTCTAACTSGIRVHEEVKQHGRIVNPACLKDLDCVSACPQQALSYGFTKPALFKSHASGGRFGSLPYNFSVAEELLAAFLFLVALLAFRGLYGRIPFLLSLALGVVVAYLSILSVRLVARPNVTLSTFRLRKHGRLTLAGYGFAGFTFVLCLFVAHSAFVRYHEYAGLRQVAALSGAEEGQERDAVASAAHEHLATADRWGFFCNPHVERAMVTAAAHLGLFDELIMYANRHLARSPGDVRVHLTVAHSFVRQERIEEAEGLFRWIIDQWGSDSGEYEAVLASAHEELGGILARRGDFAASVDELSVAVDLDPKRATLRADLGGALAELGRFDEAIESLSKAVELDPGLGGANYNLGTLLAHEGRFDEAIPHYERAIEAMPEDADVYNNLGAALLRSGRIDEAQRRLERAVELNPDHADAHFNLGAAFASRQDPEQADRHLRIAARLDPRYARFLQSE